MRVLLVKAREQTDSIQPVLGLGFLAAAVRPPHEVQVVDCILRRMDPPDLTALLARAPADVVGIQAATFGLEVIDAFLAAVRRANPTTVTVVGGPHPTVNPLPTMHQFGDRLDFAFQGEAEVGFPMLLDALQARGGRADALPPDVLRAIPGLVWRAPDGVVVANATAVTDLATVAMPRWDLIDPRAYPPSPHGAFFREHPVAPVAVSRGCPFRCSFCAGSRIHGRAVRYRAIDSVMDEIRLLHDTYGVREIQFVDDNLTFNVDYTGALCDAIEALPFRLTWSCPNGVRLDRLDRALVRRMRRAGCYAAGIGIESGSERLLAQMGKGLTLASIRRQVAMLSEEGLETRGFFVLGFPGETRDEMLATIRLSLELPLDFAHFMLFHPLPGTDSWDQVAAEGRLDTVDLNAGTFAEVAYCPEGITPRALKQLHRTALLRFYMRPGRLALLLGQVRSAPHAWYLARRVVRWLQ